MVRIAVMPRARHADASTVPTRHRFTIHEYHRVADAGIFSEDDRVELLDGEIVDMTPNRSPNRAARVSPRVLSRERDPGSTTAAQAAASQFTIHGIPKRSTSIPNRFAQNVS
jgi:hypothetical protein